MAGARTARAEIGCGPIPDGIGIQIIVGAGRRFIMAVGICMAAAVGFGCRITFGVLPGSHGGARAIIADGRHCRRTPCSPLASVLLTLGAVWISVLDLGLATMHSVSRR